MKTKKTLIPQVARVMAMDGEWKEGDHPRGKGGQFGSGGAMSKEGSDLMAKSEAAVEKKAQPVIRGVEKAKLAKETRKPQLMNGAEFKDLVGWRMASVMSRPYNVPYRFKHKGDVYAATRLTKDSFSLEKV